jgi:hypothetical protein
MLNNILLHFKSCIFIKNNPMKKFVFICIMFSMVQQLAIANGIYGKITNQDNKPYAGVVIFLLDSNNTELAKILTNADGDYGFTIQNALQYKIVVQLNDSITQQIDDIAAGQKDLFFNFVFTQKYFSRDKNSQVISASELEKMPTQQLMQQLATQANFDKDANGNLRSRTLGNGVQLIVDGQVIHHSNQLQLVPGSVGSMEVIKR